MYESIDDLLASLTMKSSFWAMCLSKIKKQANTQKLPDFIVGVGADSNGDLFLEYDFDNLNQFDDVAINSFLRHEVEHLLNNHITRGNELKLDAYNFDLFSIAADMAINCNNPELKEEYILNGKPFKPYFPKNYGFENGLLAEEYFNLLKQKNPSELGLNPPDNESEESQENGENSPSNNGDESTSKENGENSPSNNDSSDENNNQNNTENSSQLNSQQSHQVWKNSSDDPTMEFIIDNSIRNLVDTTAKDYHKAFGSLPGDIEEKINQLLKPPKLPYYYLIKRYVIGSRLGKEKISYSKINRKRMFIFSKENKLKNISYIPPFPSHKKDKTFYIGVLLDTSASIPIDDDGIYEALSGVESIIKDDKLSKIILIQNDTKIIEEKEIKHIRDINRIVIKGRGGTNLLPGLHRFKELKTDVVIVFTDGFFQDLSQYIYSLPKKIIWVLPENKSTTRNIGKVGHIVEFPVKK